MKISVLGYKEYGCWVAHALEMDVIGVGDTWQEALCELKGNVCAHISFAKYRGDESLLHRPAPPHLFKKFKRAQAAGLRDLIGERQNGKSHIRSDALAIRRSELEYRFVAA